MDPKEMEQYVDWFGFMAYDLHGAWDAEVKTIGALVRPQTDLREITNNTLPLWFDKLNPTKVNLGLAYYGRGFTLTDKSCNYMGCSFKGPSKSGPCTNSAGVMSNREIMQLIKKNNLTPTLIREAQVKQIAWEDQWMGYDDDETIAAKIKTANSLCLGGTMIWSIDFDSGSGSGDVPDKGFGTDASGPSSGGGNNPESGSSGNSGGGSSGNGVGSGVVYVDGTVWTDPQPLVACEPPCVLILPPIQLPSSTVITFPALTTTYVTKTIPGDDAGQGALPTLLTVTTVIAIPPVTTTEIEVWAITIFPSDPTDATFTPVQSVMPPSIVATFPGPPRTRQTAVGASTMDTKSHDQIFYPQPTFSVDLPPMAEISYTRGAPKPSCTTHCGHHDCQIFRCGGGCSLFGCGGNCGLLGCGGGCGLFACGGACGILGCGGCGLAGCGSACQGCGANIVTTASDTSSGEDVNPEDDNDDADDDEDDDEIEACLLAEADLANGFSPADDGINEVEDVASNPADSTSTRAPSSTRGTTTSVAASTTTTVAASTTTTVAPKPPPPSTPSPQAICYFDQGSTPLWFYTIRRMFGAWVQDGGIKLWREIRGCELVGRFNWAEDKNDGKGAKVEFYAGSWMKKGCVGRAIRSAGGPEVSC